MQRAKVKLKLYHCQYNFVEEITQTSENSESLTKLWDVS